MDLKKKMENFNKRWNITSDDNSEKNFEKFKISVLNILKNVDNHIEKEDVQLFCRFFGIEEVWHVGTLRNREWGKNIINKLRNEDKEEEFYEILEVIFSLNIRSLTGYGREIYSKNNILRKVDEAIYFSNVNLAISITKEKEIIFHPKGEEVLDKEIINNVLTFLSDKSDDHFADALKFYQSKKPVKSAESLRRSIEEFFRFKLNNGANLKENLSRAQLKLKEDNRDSNIRKIIFQTFNYLDLYFNENSKHKDGDINDSECEYLIYQVGNLLKYLENNL